MSRDKYNYPLHEVEPINDLKEMITKSAKKYSHQLAFVYQNQVGEPLTEVTYQDFEQQLTACSLAWVNLLKLDLDKREGKKVALLAPNSYDWVLAYLSTVNLNQVIVPMDYQLPTTDLLNLLKRAGVSAVVFHSMIDEKIKEIKAELPKVKHYLCLDKESQWATNTWSEFKSKGAKLLAKQSASYQKIKIYNETLCTLIFTSGTTSLPKGVMLTHKNFAQDVMGACQLLDFNQERLLSILPLYHSYESTLGLFCQLYRGSTIYYLAGGLASFAENLQIARPTTLFLVPLIAEGSYRRIVAGLKDNQDQKALIAAAQAYFGGSLRKMVVGGAPLNPVIADKLEEIGIKVIQGYGISENSPAAAINRDLANKHQAVGLPLPNIKVEISQPNNEGVGEVIIRGGTVMLGYYKDDRKTDEAIINNWLHTGDYGYFDEDGFLYIVGRKKNVIIGKNAKNVYPEELEFLLNNTIGIQESLVYGKIEDEDVSVAALIVPDIKGLQNLQPQLGENPSQDQIQKILEEQIQKVNENNAPYKAIKSFQLVSQLTKTPTGKLKRQI